MFFFSDCSLLDSSNWGLCAFVQRFRRVFWRNPQVHAVVVRYSWEAYSRRHNGTGNELI